MSWGIVYYARIGDAIKIGRTTQYESRMWALDPDEVLAWEPGDSRTETARLRQFRDDLARDREWFHPSPDLLAHIETVRTEHGAPREWRPARRWKKNAHKSRRPAAARIPDQAVTS